MGACRRSARTRGGMSLWGRGHTDENKAVGTVVVTDRERALLEKKTYPIGAASSFSRRRRTSLDAEPPLLPARLFASAAP